MFKQCKYMPGNRKYFVCTDVGWGFQMEHGELGATVAVTNWMHK